MLVSCAIKYRKIADDLPLLNKTPVIEQTVPFFCQLALGSAQRLVGEMLPPTVLEVDGDKLVLFIYLSETEPNHNLINFKMRSVKTIKMIYVADRINL